MEKKYSIKLKFKRSIDIQSPELTLPAWLDISQTNILSNLGVDTLSQFKTCLNKNFYCDQSNTFGKNFGIKTKNFNDLNLTPVNLIPDNRLVIDTNSFAFSAYDLENLTYDSCHPYLNKQKLSQTYVNQYYLQLYNAEQSDTIINGSITVINFYQKYLRNLFQKSPVGNSYPFPIINDQQPASDLDIFNQELNTLENNLQEIISYDFFTINLVSIYRNIKCDKHLDYTILLLYNIINLIPDFRLTYVKLILVDYFNIEDDGLKYRKFLMNLVKILETVKTNLNYEKFNYLSIIMVKILQYRFCQINDGLELFKYLKEFVKTNQQTELYWSILLCPSNHFNEKTTGQISLYSISIDNIYSNTKFETFYYTMLVYLHTKYMQMASQENGEMHRLLNHDKDIELYSYLDVIQYFNDLYEYVKENSLSLHLKQRFQNLVKRYFLDPNYIKIDRQGQIFDSVI